MVHHYGHFRFRCRTLPQSPPRFFLSSSSFAPSHHRHHCSFVQSRHTRPIPTTLLISLKCPERKMGRDVRISHTRIVLLHAYPEFGGSGFPYCFSGLLNLHSPHVLSSFRILVQPKLAVFMPICSPAEYDEISASGPISSICLISYPSCTSHSPGINRELFSLINRVPTVIGAFTINSNIALLILNLESFEAVIF